MARGQSGTMTPVMVEATNQACDLCSQTCANEHLARGRKFVICRNCVEAGLSTTLRSNATRRDGETVPRAYKKCSMCSNPTPPPALYEAGAACACISCLGECYSLLTQELEVRRRRRAHFKAGAERHAATLLQHHFRDFDDTEIVTTTRTFPSYLRADLQHALDQLWQGRDPHRVGLAEHSWRTLTYASLLDRGHSPVLVAPLQYEDVDIGEAEPVRCLRTGLWLSPEGERPHAMLLAQAHEHGRTRGWHVEICVPAGPEGEQLARKYFKHLEGAIQTSASYRGKVLSLECESHYSGAAAGNIVVHKIGAVQREDIILPTQTLELLERNVFNFVAQRERLRQLQLPVKKGLLFYGPPGTGKTHTIRYLAAALPDHSMLLVTAEQCKLISEYTALARLLSPAILVIEDVDLIAREREELQTATQESLLNRLLNEMDGLKEDAEILFILTTNHPESLEAAVAGRPGRIDQAIEFPLPDESGRQRLVELYRRGLRVSEELNQDIVRRTQGVSAAFIKELMRRAAQFAFERAPTTTEATRSDLDHALNELLFEGGKLNAKLLGASSRSVEG